MENIILRNNLCPGDVCAMTTAVKMLKEQHGDKFNILFKGTAADLFKHNPYIGGFNPKTDAHREITMHYPLIHQSNQRMNHFLYAYVDYLAKELRVPLELTDNKPDIYMSKREISAIDPVQVKTGIKIPYWIMVGGGKRDFTLKWWKQERWQELVDHFKDKICFVQVGHEEHVHKDLKGVIDMRGTSIREIIKLMYHAQGVVCPVTFMMHLSAGVDTPCPVFNRRATVVLAGGREPAQWTHYPWQRYLSTVGELPCCADGGCWKTKDHECDMWDEAKKTSKCMDSLTVPKVAAAILSYFRGDRHYLSPAEIKHLKEYLT